MITPTVHKHPDSAAKQVYSTLKNDILSGAIGGGYWLRQDDIAEQHGVSKIPVREALRQLEMEGLVEFRPRRGAVVRQVSDQDILDMLDIRVALECRALELAVPHMAEADFMLAQEIQDEYEALPHEEHWSELNRRFHSCIYEPCINPQLLKLIREFELRVGPLMRLRVTEVAGIERPIREHADILQQCRKGAVDKAVLALRAHIETTKRDVAAAIRRRAMKSAENCR